MTDPAATPSYRLKVPCADEREFRDKYLKKFVARGVFVPAAKPMPVGTRLTLRLEIRGGTVLVAGDGLVTSISRSTEGSGMTVRLTSLHPSSLQFDLSPAAGGGAPAAPARAVPSAPAIVPPPPPLTAPYDDLADLSEGLSEGLSAGRPADPTRAKASPDEPLAAASDPFAASPAVAPDPAEEIAIDVAGPEEMAGPEPAEASAAPGGGGALLDFARRRRVAVLLAAVAVVGVGTAVGATLRARAARARIARVEEQLRLADLRLAEGRLTDAGGDSSLDHLLEAKGAAPFDPRVESRLTALADDLERRGNEALARRRLQEAAFYMKATLLADPRRAGARAGLDAVQAKLARSPGGR